MVSGSLDTVVVNRQSIPRGGYPHPPRIVNAITKQQQQKQNLHIHHPVPQQQQAQHSPFQLRFSDGPLRPWPPMYTANQVIGGGGSSSPQVYHGPPPQQQQHQYRSMIAKHNNNYQLYLNNLKNLYAYNTMKSSASSKYNKFMFHHQQHQGEPPHHAGFMLNAPPNGMMNAQGHLQAAAAAAAKSKEQHFMQSYFQSQKNMNAQQMYQKASSQYSMKEHGGGSSSMSESEQKQIRRLRSTQSMPPPNPCGCNGRSKSMEDIRDVIVDWTVSPQAPPSVGGGGPKQKLNNAVQNNNGPANNYFMNNNSNKMPETYGYNNKNTRFIANANYIINGQLANIKNKNNMRRSMDNLLEIETNNYPQNFQHTALNNENRPKFVAVTSLEDVQAVRCAEFHPNGKVYAVGSNSKTFRICEYPSLAEIREDHTTFQPTVLFKRTKHHKGSIYCMAWSPQGDLVATGSNDKTVKLMKYNDVQKQLEGREIELTMHDGTIRDLCFIEDSLNKASLLISGGAGDCKIYVTDCATSTPFQALSGHGGHVLSLYNWGGAMFVSGSHDKTVRFWDLRTRGCVNVVTPVTAPGGSRQGSPVAAVSVDPSGRLLVSGHEDSSCVLYDIRGNRPIQCFKPHSSDIRSIRFSPSAYYLLSAGYDNKLVLTDLQGDLTMPLPSVVVAQHSDKAISGRWHPTDFSFLSTSADKTATLWALPPI